MKFEHLAMKALTVEQLNQCLQRYFSQFDITAFAFTWYCQHIKTGNPLHYHWASKPLLAWHHYYLAQAYADVDRTLEATANTVLPQWWDVKQQLMLAKNSRERQIRIESIEYGIDIGVSLPLSTPEGDVMTLVLHQFQHQRCLENHRDKVMEWQGALHYYFYHLNRLLKPQLNNHKQLTRREYQCLQLTARQYRVEQIAAELAISQRTVNFHLQNANKKLGTNNKYQAVMKIF